MSSYYYTTPIFYTNDSPHIGHTYSTILCDFFARYTSLCNEECIWSTGTDEHGQKIADSAIKKNKQCIEYVDEISKQFFSMGKKFNISNNIFTRTTSKEHFKTVKKIWQTLEQNNFTYKGKYCGWYAVRDEAFYNDSEIKDGVVIATGAEVSWVEEDTYFFKLSSLTDQLLEFYEKNPNFIYPQTRYNEVKSFIKEGLKDISVSRKRVSWGIPVPNDDVQTIYVWLDALSSYLTSLEFTNNNSNLYEKFWSSNESKKIHIIGKDILRFHAIYWPAFLMAANLSLPNHLIVHGWWTNDGEKISKSLGNVIDPIKLADEFSVEYVRYFLLREMNIGNDGDFNKKIFIQKINSELADNIGNLIQRVLVMIHKNDINFEDIVFDKNLLDDAYNIVSEAKHIIKKYNPPQYIECIITIASMANSYINKKEPWSLAKNKKIDELSEVLISVTELIRIIAIMLIPVIPDSAKKITQILQIEEDLCNMNCLSYHYAVHKKPLQSLGVIFPKIQ